MKRRGERWKQELAKKPSERQVAALDALHRGSKPQNKDEPRPPNFFDELEDAERD